MLFLQYTDSTSIRAPPPPVALETAAVTDLVASPSDSKVFEVSRSVSIDSRRSDLNVIRKFHGLNQIHTCNRGSRLGNGNFQRGGVIVGQDPKIFEGEGGGRISCLLVQFYCKNFLIFFAKSE